MRRSWLAATLASLLMSATTAQAIVPVIPPPAYTAQELADLKSKAAKGDVAAQSELGRAYLYGQRVVTHEAEGLHWLNMAAAQSDGAAEEALGNVYLQGKGVTANKAKALDWFSRAVAHGQSTARNWADDLTRQHDTYIKLQTAAQTGDAAAQYAFAAFMPPERPGYGGHGWGEDDAIKWYSLSAKQGYAPAEAWMGFYYLMGAIRDKTGPTAPHAAWENDDKIGIYVLGKAAIAADWYEKAAAQGNDEALHVLPAVYAISRGYDTPLLEKAMRASALRAVPPRPSQDLLSEARAGRLHDDMAVDAERGHIFEDLAKLCAWYDGEPAEWHYNHLTDDVEVIHGQPQPDKAMDCYQHQADIGVETGGYVVAYRREYGEKPDVAQAEAAFRKLWDGASYNSGLATRAAAHIGLMARDRKETVTAYAWLSVAARGDMMISPNGAGMPDERNLKDLVTTALAELKLTASQKSEGDRQTEGLLAQHPPSPPLAPPPTPVTLY